MECFVIAFLALLATYPTLLDPQWELLDMGVLLREAKALLNDWIHRTFPGVDRYLPALVLYYSVLYTLFGYEVFFYYLAQIFLLILTAGLIWATLRVSALGDQGNARLNPIQVSLEPASVNGSLRLKSSDGRLSASLPLLLPHDADAFYAHIAQDLGFFTGVAVLNPHGHDSLLVRSSQEKPGNRSHSGRSVPGPCSAGGR
ncbi:MAG: hypothetical protein IH937_14965 [Acidobacteria bacterium]|nr:hypothetical protein [Acidobacteriota bacterium]